MTPAALMLLVIVTVFASDNGSPVGGWGAGGSNHPLKGGKGSSWEGGLRTFAVVAGGWLPARQRGKIVHGLSHIVDLYATFCSLASGVMGSPKADTCLANSGIAAPDSLDLSEWWAGRAHGSPRYEILHEHSPGIAVLRRGDFKLIAQPTKQAHWFGEFSPHFNSSLLEATAIHDAWLDKSLAVLRAQRAAGNLSKREHFLQRVRLMRSPSPMKPVSRYLGALLEREECSFKQPCLYNIAEDPEERHDLAKQLPQKAAALKARAAEIDRAEQPGYSESTWGLDLKAPKNKTRYCAAAAASHGFLVPWRS